jgi:small GTP-binding protein
MPDWLSRKSKTAEKATDSIGDDPLDLAQESLDALINDKRVPEEVRQSLMQDYSEVQAMLDRLEHGHLHIAVFGRVSVGKSALLNAMLGENRFSTSPLHGETIQAERGQWQEYEDGGVFLIDTPGINEVDGEAREQLAREVAGRADLVLFVVDSDLTETETRALREITAQHRPIILVLNKSDRYSPAEQDALMRSITNHTRGIIDERNIVMASADPAERLIIRVDEGGNETEEWQRPATDIARVKERLWDILQSEGNTLAALNASLFASELSDQVGERVLNARRELGQSLIRKYCTAKGVAVALNPVPVADLVAAAVVDVSMIVHLSRFYALPLTRNEASELIKTIGGQMLLLMGTVWAVHFISSALKLGSAGLTTLITGGAQGAVAYYSTWVVGQAAERYLAQGKSWGEGGPKLVVREILDNLDRDSILKQAKQDIKAHLQSS